MKTMFNARLFGRILLFALSLLLWDENEGFAQKKIPVVGNVSFQRGDIARSIPNAFEIQTGADSSVALYRPISGNQPEMFLLTEVHRDSPVFAELCNANIVVVGEKETGFLTDPRKEFWDQFLLRGRFNEENCVSLDRPFRPIRSQETEVRGVRDGQILKSGSYEIHVLETPGVWRNSVSYQVDIFGERLLFTGDLIQGDGKIPDLFSLQDVFPEGEIGGYHGFMARTPKLIASLEKIRALKPDVIYPANGPIIENPDQAIENLIGRLREVYRNYLSTCALWWYFGEKRMSATADAILGTGPDRMDVPRMNEAKKFENPDWLTEIDTTRLIRSETGEMFVLDIWGKNAIQKILDLHKEKKIKNVDGIFVTHYHHDHNAGVPVIQKFFTAPVYGVGTLCDILERPGAYRMPCIENVSFPVTVKQEGESMKWREFEFTFFDYPGQTLYHNALLVRKNEERPILFVGDSFTPTGIDDYSLWNRNFIRNGKGYLYCLDKIRQLQPNPMIVNQHVVPPFEFDAARLDYMENALRKRAELLGELIAKPEINFGLDHAWCRLDPFVGKTEADGSIQVSCVITNHFDRRQTFRVELCADDNAPFQIPVLLTPKTVNFCQEDQRPTGAGFFNGAEAPTANPGSGNAQKELTVESGEEARISWFFPAPERHETKASDKPSYTFLSAKVYTSDKTLGGQCEAVFEIDITPGK